jgi:hypothetical protein
MFWLATAMLYGCQRTLQVQAWHAEVEAAAEAEQRALIPEPAQGLRA